MSESPAAADHLFVLLFAVVYPLVGFFSFRRLQRRIEAGYKPDRPRLYRHTLIGHWLLLLVGLFVWQNASRPVAGLGFRFDLDTVFLLALGFTIAAISFLVLQVRQAQAADREFLDAVDRSFGVLRHLLPRSRGELQGFYAVGVTAGVVEEVLWRGFLMAYLGRYVPTEAAAAIVIAGFGLAHAYQGARAIPKVTLAGAVFTVLYLASGSLWLPIVLHAAVDVLQGRLAYDVISRRRLYADDGK